MKVWIPREGLFSESSLAGGYIVIGNIWLDRSSYSGPETYNCPRDLIAMPDTLDALVSNMRRYCYKTNCLWL
jgi:hypothetical protein